MSSSTRRVAPAKKAAAPAAPATGQRPRVRPAKTAAKKAAAPQPQVLEGEVLSAVDEEPDGLQTAKVPFMGRDIEVQMPTLEQVTVYERVAAQFAALNDDAKPLDGTTATKLYGRAFRVISSIVVHPEDVEWLEDLLLDRKTDLAGLTPLLGQSMDKLKAANAHLGNREQRRANARLAD